jgi:hypothetical protein
MSGVGAGVGVGRAVVGNARNCLRGRNLDRVSASMLDPAEVVNDGPQEYQANNRVMKLLRVQ